MFRILGLTLVLSLGAGFLAGGRIGRLAELRFRATPLVFLGAVLGMLPLVANMGDGANRAVVGAANLLVVVFLWINASRHRGAVRAGIAVLLAGWLLNAIVIASNGGMPLSEWAYARSGQTDPITEGEGGFFKIVVAGPGTRLKFLGDAIPISPLRQVLSTGDLALMAGIGIVIAAAMRGNK